MRSVRKWGVDLMPGSFQYQNGSYRYFYYQNSVDTSPLLVLIHGAPGSSLHFVDFLKNKLITDHYSVLIVDRPGYGNSEYGTYFSIRDQSDILIELIQSLTRGDQDVFVAGHSYGGTIAAAIASLRPSFLAASALMAPALDPKNEKYFWYGRLGTWKFTRWMASGALKVAADEKYAHAEELEWWSTQWKNMDTPVLHIHGNKDKLVPYVNVTYAQRMISDPYHEVFEWDGMNHFFPFSKTDQTIELLHAFFQKHKTLVD